MNITTNELTGRTQALLTTEIMFFVVSAKSTNTDLIKLKIKGEDGEAASEKDLETVAKILRSVKRRKMIQLFVASSEFGARTTEMEYLLNKYPELPRELTDDIKFVVKL